MVTYKNKKWTELYPFPSGSNFEPYNYEEINCDEMWLTKYTIITINIINNPNDWMGLTKLWDSLKPIFYINYFTKFEV